MLKQIIKIFLLIIMFSPLFTYANESFIVDWSDWTKSTWPCVGKTVCHISWNLTYSNITLKNWAKLSHRQWTLTVVNDFVIWSWSSSYFVWQDLNVWHLLKITNASIFSLNSKLTSEPTSTTIDDWMWSTYYDLSVTNTDKTFNWLDVVLNSWWYVKTKNVIVNSKFKLESTSTNCYWNTYANGYFSIDGDANIKNIKMDIDGYVYVWWNLNHDTSWASNYYFYVRWKIQSDTPLSTEFVKSWINTTWNISFTWHTTTPTPFFSYATSWSAWDNIYASWSITMYKMKIWSWSVSSTESLWHIESRNSFIKITDTNNLYTSSNIKAQSTIDISNITDVWINDIKAQSNIDLNNIDNLDFNDTISYKWNIVIDNVDDLVSRDIDTNIWSTTIKWIWTSNDIRNITSKTNISISRTSLWWTLNAYKLTNSWALSLQNISTYNRLWDILSKWDILFKNITTSSWANTDVTSTLWKVTFEIWTLHTYNDITSYWDNTITDIVKFEANNIASNAKLTVSSTNIEITNTDDEDNEWSTNIDIATGWDFTITNSTWNLARSAIQINGWLEINNTLWKSQNLNINWYKTIDGKKVWIYFRWWRDRYINGNVFAWGWSIWVWTSATPDNWNILLSRNAQFVTNGWLKVYRSTNTNIDRFSYISNDTITENLWLFSQLYNAASSRNKWTLTATWVNLSDPSYLIDENTSSSATWFYSDWNSNKATFWTATFWHAVFNGTKNDMVPWIEFTFARNMSISKLCTTSNDSSSDAIKMQFKNSSEDIVNTQTIQLTSKSEWRTCFDLNTTNAKKVYVTWYPWNLIWFQEIEFWWVPTDIANISVSLNDDIVLSNGSYEIGGNITSKDITITSTSSKKLKVTQYSPNGVFDAKSSILLSNSTSWNTLITHSVWNELWLKFVTDSMNVWTWVLIDTSWKWYLWWSSISELTTSDWWSGNIIAWSTPMRAWDGWLYWWIWWYWVSWWWGWGWGWYLYPFYDHTFTSCWSTGRFWPSIDNCKNSYSTDWSKNENFFTQWSYQWYQLWTVPKTWVYRITSYWAKWWDSYNWVWWWYWAIMRWDFTLTKWEKIIIAVWQQWASCSYNCWWWWWTFVVKKDSNTPLIISWWWWWWNATVWWNACWSSYSNANATTSTSGYNKSCYSWTNYGWTWWSWGRSQQNYRNWAGWWWFHTPWEDWWWSSSYNWWWWWSFFSWLLWWSDSSRVSGAWFWWWWAWILWWGWGWGWYSWWAWWNWYRSSYNDEWWWGWSYNNWSNQSNTIWNNWDWKVVITLINNGDNIAISSWAWWWNLWYGWNGWSSNCEWSVWNNELWNTRWWDWGWVNWWSWTNWHGGWGMTFCSGWWWWTWWNSDTNPYRLGSWWWAWWFIKDDFTTWYGWNGWWMIRISTNNLEINWKLLANWANWQDYNSIYSTIYWAWWWWAWGSILIRAKELNCNTWNSIEVAWWNWWAWTGWDFWWWGWWGWVVTYYYTEKNWTCAWVLSAWSAWFSWWWANWQVWLSYESAWTTFDTLRSRVIIEDSPAEANWTSEIKVRAYFLDVNWVPLEWEYLVAEVVWDLWSWQINNWNPLPQTDANGMIEFPITSTKKWIKKVILKNAVTYTELQEQPTITFGIPQISIEKVANKSIVNSWDVVTYTITVTNSWSWDAWWDVENAIIVEDVLPTWFRYYTTWPTAGSKWDTGSWSTQYYIFPETSWDGTSWNEERLRYTITDGISWPANIPANWWKVRIIFDVKVP